MSLRNHVTAGNVAPELFRDDDAAPTIEVNILAC
jgi:hypothetical protein